MANLSPPVIAVGIVARAGELAMYATNTTGDTTAVYARVCAEKIAIIRHELTQLEVAISEGLRDARERAGLGSLPPFHPVKPGLRLVEPVQAQDP